MSANDPVANRWLRTTAIAAGAAGGVAGAGAFAGAAAGVMALTRPVRPACAPVVAAVDVSEPHAVTLAGVGADTPGVVGLKTDRGRLLAGPPVDVAGGWRREVFGLRGEPFGLPLVAGADVTVHIDPWADTLDPFGVGADQMRYDAEGGPLPAIRSGPADADRAVVFVHGRGGQRNTGWWLAPTAADAGWATVMPAYRNDVDAGGDAGRYLLGGEWLDLASALDWLAADGMRHVVLAGWSMGGNICASYLRARTADPERFAHHPQVSGLVLDAAALDWGLVLRNVARHRRIPAALISLVMAWGQVGSRIDWRALNHLADPAHLDLPLLAVHGDDDQVVPTEVTHELAARLPQAQPLIVAGGGHCRSVNIDPAGYLDAFGTFLRRL